MIKKNYKVLVDDINDILEHYTNDLIDYIHNDITFNVDKYCYFLKKDINNILNSFKKEIK